jgi:DNA-binding protein H-NS
MRFIASLMAAVCRCPATHAASGPGTAWRDAVVRGYSTPKVGIWRFLNGRILIIGPLWSYILHRFRNNGWVGKMAKAVRGRPRKKAARKAPVPVKRKAAAAPLTSAAKLKMLVDNLTAKDLDELIKIATDRKNAEIAGARASFLDEVKSRAASLGMSLADLVGLGGAKGSTTGAGPAVKYRNPATGETWSGRGRPAKWITELEAKGQKREKFAI